ncbi:MAG: c-type cytochrome, partial [Syntrophothermus sp.]
MSTSLGVIIRRLAMILLFAAAALAVTMLFTYDVIKVEWPSFMEIQPSYRQMENPLPVPAQAIPIEGPITVPGMGVPQNPMKADDASLARGRELFAINCKMCHGDTGEGTGPVAPFLIKFKPANLTRDVVQSKS